MKRIVPILLAGAAALTVAAPATASPQVTLTPDAPAAQWTGPKATGFNISYYRTLYSPIGPASCANTDEQTRCDTTKIFVDADTYAPGSKVTFRIEGFRQVDDFDLRVYDLGSKPDSAGTYVGNPTGDAAKDSPLGGDDPRETFNGDFETREGPVLKTDRWYRVEVVYFAVADGDYVGKVSATGLGKTPAAG